MPLFGGAGQLARSTTSHGDDSMSTNRLTLAVCMSLISIAGCSDQPDTVQSGSPSGSLIYKETPVAQVQVTFHTPGSTEQLAFGVTDADGAFRLFTTEGNSTVLDSGEYHVTAENIGEPTWTLPSKYHNPAKTPLHIEVVAGEPIDISIP